MNSISISKNDQFVVSGSADNTVKLWNLLSKSGNRVIAKCRSIVSSVSFLKDD